MNGYLKLIFSFFLLATFLFEGLGINNGREVAYYLILLMPFFLFAPQFFSKSGKNIVFPVKFTFIFLVFMIFSLFSSVFSVDLQNSFQNLFLYIALFLVFIFVFNYKELVKNSVLYLIFVLSFIFSIFSLFINYFVRQNSIFSVPIDLLGQGYQFIYSVGGHNHLGDFLLLPLTVLIFRLLNQKFKLENLFLLLLFIPYLIFSYSRSAYLDLILVTPVIIYYASKNKRFLKKKFVFYILGFMFSALLAVFIFAVPMDTKKPAFFNSINSVLQQKYDLQRGKTFFASRNFYATEGLFSFSNKPLFGVGPGNFEYASQKYMNNPLEFAPTTHNLFFDTLVENGLLAEIAFLLLFLQIFHSIRYQFFNHSFGNSNSIFTLLFLVMLFNFQTDYTFLIWSFFLLFFVLIGLIYNEKRTIELKFLVPVFSLVLLLIFNLAIFSNILVSKGNYLLAFYSYPLNKEVYVPLVNNQLSLNNKQAAFKYLNYYVKLFNGDSDVLVYAGNVYYAYLGEDKGLPFYERAVRANNFIDPAIIRVIYNIKLDVQGQGKAKAFADKYFLRLSGADKNSQYYQVYYGYRLAAFKVCKGIYSGNCPYAL